MIVEFLNLIKNKKELVILLLSIFLCVIAIYNPVVTIKKSITSYMFLVDLSQSMNAEDLKNQDTRCKWNK